MSKKKARLTTPELMEKLAYKYAGEAWAFFEQVRSGTGYLHQVRTADAIAMGLWPSRGLELLGFEVKIYRADWLKELKTPRKADELVGFCDRWWIVALKDVARVEEIPTTWGLMVPHGLGLRVVKAAPELKPEPVDRLFLASLLRKAKVYVAPAKRTEAKIKAAWEEGRAKGAEHANWHWKNIEQPGLERLADGAKRFQEQTGIELSIYSAEDIATAVNLLRRQPSLTRKIEDTSQLVKGLEAALVSGRDLLAALTEVQKKIRGRKEKP